MPPPHALENQIIARLQGKMEVGHEPLLLRKSAHELAVGFDRIDRRQAQAFQILSRLEDAAHETAERRPARQIIAPGGNIDAREHDFRVAVGDKTPDLLDDIAGGNRT